MDNVAKIPPPLHLLAKLPEYVRGYGYALANNDLQAEEERCSKICSVIEFVLEYYLQRSDGWDASAWIDGVLSTTFALTEVGVVSVGGLVVWSGNRGWFLDPLTARIELSQDGMAVRTYSIAFGDKDEGLGKFKYKPYSKDRYRPPPLAWCFVFGHEEAAAASDSS